MTASPNVDALLSRCRVAGVRLRVAAGTLAIAGTVPDDLRSDLRSHRAQIVAALEPVCDQATPPITEPPLDLVIVADMARRTSRDAIDAIIARVATRIGTPAERGHDRLVLGDWQAIRAAKIDNGCPS